MARKLGELGVPDLGTPEHPRERHGQVYIRKDGFWYFQDAGLFREGGHGPFGHELPGKLYMVTDPKYQDLLDAWFAQEAQDAAPSI